MAVLRYIIYFACIFGSVFTKHEFYDGYSVYQVTVTNEEQAEFVSQLVNTLPLDIWSHPLPSRPGQVMMPKAAKEDFQNELSSVGIEYEVLTENVKELLDLEDSLMANARSKTSGNTAQYSDKVKLPLDRILTYEEVERYLKEISEKYPNVASLHSAGKSVEGREMWYLKISTTNFQDTKKPVVFINSLLHARDWITLPASLYAIQHLVVEPSERDLLEAVDWIVMPVANPDGYVLSHDDRRFNFQNRATSPHSLCIGVDLNRNFNFNWGQAITSSNDPCSANYHGTGPASEPETQAISRIMLEHTGRLALYIDLQGIGSTIVFGYGNGQLPANALTLNMVAVRQAQAINAVKTQLHINYIVGNYANVKITRDVGSAMDYAKSVGVPLSYMYDLPARLGAGNGLLGFLVDPWFIEQAGMETWEGMKAAAEYVRNNRLN